MHIASWIRVYRSPTSAMAATLGMFAILGCGAAPNRAHPDPHTSSGRTSAEPREPSGPTSDGDAGPPPASSGPSDAAQIGTTVTQDGGAADAAVAAQDPAAAELAAYEAARPAFERHCARCHAGTGRRTAYARSHFSMTSYPFGGHHVHELTAAIRRSLGVGGAATMPEDDPGVVRGDDLASMLAWADAYDRAEAAGLHPRRRHPH